MNITKRKNLAVRKLSAKKSLTLKKMLRSKQSREVYNIVGGSLIAACAEGLLNALLQTEWLLFAMWLLTAVCTVIGMLVLKNKRR